MRLKFFVFKISFFVLAFAGTQAWATHPEAVYLNNEAVDLMVKENQYGAYKSLLKALELAPLDPAIQYNLGVSFLASEQFDKAMQQFELADQLAKTDVSKFRARFAAAVAATKLNKIPEALKYYQRALEIDPDNEDVKKNIELLWQGGGGEGEGDSKDKKEGEEGKQKDDKDQSKEERNKEQDKEREKQGEVKKPKPQPQQFKSQELTPDQVRKILEELKAQEQKIRADENDKDRKDQPNEKDW